MNPEISITVKEEDYGDVLHHTILTILGDELTYNKLKDYSESLDDYSRLKTIKKTNDVMGFFWFTVFIEDVKILEKKYNTNHSCDMFGFLRELEDQRLEDEEEVDEEQLEELSFNIAINKVKRSKIYNYGLGLKLNMRDAGIT